MDVTRFLVWLVAVLGVLFAIAILAWLAVRLWQVPENQFPGVSSQYERLMLANEHRKTVLSAFSTFAQVAGGLLLLSGIYFTWRSAQAAEENLRVASEGQVTERFTRATDQLGATELSRRLGGIFALERIARDSQRDHRPVMEILASFIRERARTPETRVTDDVQAAMGVIVRRNVAHESDSSPDATIGFGELSLNQIDLRGGNFSGVSFRNASMKGADFTGANLTKCDFVFADLEGARFVDAIIDEATFDSAKMRNAQFKGARGRIAYFESTDLSNASLDGIEVRMLYLQSTNLTRTSMQKVDLRSSFLNSTKFFQTILREARFDGRDNIDVFFAGADLSGANFRGAKLLGSLGGSTIRQTNFEDANLEYASDLTAEQLVFRSRSHVNEPSEWLS